ncbi:hypothetical protein REPUB_Repub09cG0000500 [Reevesia pubescens]
MESSSIELKVISGKDLKAFNFFQKLSVYALVSIASDDDKKVDQRRQKRTPTDREGDGNPEWNHTIRFEVSKTLFQDCVNVFIHFELRHEGAMFGDKTIGEVDVPFKDLIQEFNGVVRFVTYEVRTTDGKSNGVLNFSFKVNGKDQGLRMDHPVSQISGYPVLHHHLSPEAEIQFPLSEVHSESPKIHYPILELEDMFQAQGPQFHPSSSGNQDPFQETYLLPQNAYYQQPPPPPMPYPPLPAAMAHGPCFYPRPPRPSPWDPRPSPYVGAHGYNTHGSQLGFADGPLETWPKPDGWQGVWETTIHLLGMAGEVLLFRRLYRIYFIFELLLL